MATKPKRFVVTATIEIWAEDVTDAEMTAGDLDVAKGSISPYDREVEISVDDVNEVD